MVVWASWRLVSVCSEAQISVTTISLLSVVAYGYTPALYNSNASAIAGEGLKIKWKVGAILAACFVSAQALAEWPVLAKGAVVCDTLTSAMEQAHYFMQGIDELADSKHCGRLKADTEYASIGAQFIRSASGSAVESISLIRIRKNKLQAYYVPKD